MKSRVREQSLKPGDIDLLKRIDSAGPMGFAGEVAQGWTGKRLFDAGYIQYKGNRVVTTPAGKKFLAGQESVPLRRNEALRAAIKAEVRRLIERQRAAEARFYIMYQYRDGEPEEVDTADTESEAEALLQEYKMSHGRGGGKVWVESGFGKKVMEALDTDMLHKAVMHARRGNDWGMVDAAIKQFIRDQKPSAALTRELGVIQDTLDTHPMDAQRLLKAIIPRIESGMYESVQEQELNRRQRMLLDLVKDAGPGGYEVGGFGHPDASTLYRMDLVDMKNNSRGIMVLTITPKGQAYQESVREEFYRAFRAELVPLQGGGRELQALGKGFAVDVVNDSKGAAKKALEQLKQWAKNHGFGAILIGARLGDVIGSRSTIVLESFREAFPSIRWQGTQGHLPLNEDYVHKDTGKSYYFSLKDLSPFGYDGTVSVGALSGSGQIEIGRFKGEFAARQAAQKWARTNLVRRDYYQSQKGR